MTSYHDTAATFARVHFVKQLSCLAGAPMLSVQTAGACLVEGSSGVKEGSLGMVVKRCRLVALERNVKLATDKATVTNHFLLPVADIATDDRNTDVNSPLLSVTSQHVPVTSLCHAAFHVRRAGHVARRRQPFLACSCRCLLSDRRFPPSRFRSETQFCANRGASPIAGGSD